MHINIKERQAHKNTASFSCWKTAGGTFSETAVLTIFNIELCDILLIPEKTQGVGDLETEILRVEAMVGT